MSKTIDRRLYLLPLKADHVSDTHPEMLLEWTQDGATTPPHWFHLAAYTDTGMLLMLMRERLEENSDRAMPLARGIYWHVSREYIGEVARQLCEGARQALAFNTTSNRFVHYRVGYVVISQCADDGHTWNEITTMKAKPDLPAPGTRT